MSKKEKFLSIAVSAEAKRRIISAFCQDMIKHIFKSRAKEFSWILTTEKVGIMEQNIWSVPNPLPSWLNVDSQVDIYLISKAEQPADECIKIAAIPAKEGISYHAIAKVVDETGKKCKKDAFSQLPQEMHSTLYDAIECLRKSPEVFLALSPIVIK